MAKEYIDYNSLKFYTDKLQDGIDDNKTKISNLESFAQILTQAQYDALTTKDPNKIYFIKG